MFELRVARNFACLCVFAGCFFQPAYAQNKSDPDKFGIALAKDPDGNKGITAHDVIGLVDGKLKNNFDSLTMVFGGCYSDAFTTAANNAPNLKNGKVAVLAATGEKGACKTPAPPLGNPFVNGVIQGFAGGNTVSQAFDNGVKGVQRFENDEHNKNVKTDQNFELTNPTPTYFGDGKSITLKGNPKKQYAILFVGFPDSFADWNDVATQFQALVDEGWNPKNITVFFGNGAPTSAGPVLPNGTTVVANAESKNKSAELTYTDSNGKKQPIFCKEATFANLKEKLTQWAAFAKVDDAKPTQFYILFGGHSTNDAKDRTNLLSQFVRPSSSSTAPPGQRTYGEPASLDAPSAASGCSSGCLAGLPSGLSLEASAFAGGTFATSFGSDFDTSAFGGRFAAAFQIPQNVRFQIDFEGEGSGAYCTTCGSHDYFAGAAHADWSALPNFEFGAFGGAQYARPTFGAPTSTNGFAGVEGRVFIPHAVFGGNAGYFDVSSGPGTLKNAWFAEGRAKFELAYVFGAGKLRGPTLEFGGGYASGNLSGFLNNSASSAQWHTTLAAPILDTPLQGFLRYAGHINRVDGLGTVWTEHAVVGGVQINLGCQCQKNLEPMMPLPFLLRTVTTF